MPSTFANLYITLFIAILLGLSGCGNEDNSKIAALPGANYNIAIILVDTLRPDHLGCYGYDKPTSPTIDKLAAEGVLFENAYSASTFTGEAVSALFTGRPPAMNSTGLGWTSRPTPMDENLPKRLEAAGYKTGIFSTSFVMRFRGFYDSFQEAELFPGMANSSSLDTQLTDAALDFSKRHQGERTFQYLHYYAPHAPYNPPPENLAPFHLDRAVLTPSEDSHPAALVSEGMEKNDPRLAEFKKHYDGEIAFIDQSIQRYIDGLRELGQLSNTLIVLVSDHGEEFMEHGFADHAWTLYEETLRIPLIIWAPDLIDGQRVQERVSICDVMPTVLQLTHQGYRAPESTVAGQSLFVPGETAWTYSPRTNPIYASLFPESRAQLHAVLYDDFKYIAGPRWLDGDACRRFWFLQGTMATKAKSADFLPLDPWAPPMHEALYNLREDPGETNNLLDTDDALGETGRRLLGEYKDAGAPYQKEGAPTTLIDPFDHAFVESALQDLKDSSDSKDATPPEESRISPEVIESLETMGYL